MPGMDGLELQRRLPARNCSGYSGPSEQRRAGRACDKDCSGANPSAAVQPGQLQLGEALDPSRYSLTPLGENGELIPHP
jgi:hypothetical protein